MAIAVTSSAAVYLGQVSGSLVSTDFDARGGDLLVVAIGWSDSTGGIPTVTFAGAPLTIVSEPQPTSTDGIAAIFTLAHPASGTNPLVVGSATAFLGNTQFNAVALSGTTGSLGAVGGADASGSVQTITLSDTNVSSILLGFCVSLWNGVQVVDASAGWSPIATASGSDANGNGFTFSFSASGGSGAPSLTFTPEASGYPQYFAIAVEVLASNVIYGSARFIVIP